MVFLCVDASPSSAAPSDYVGLQVTPHVSGYYSARNDVSADCKSLKYNIVDSHSTIVLQKIKTFNCNQITGSWSCLHAQLETFNRNQITGIWTCLRPQHHRPATMYHQFKVIYILQMWSNKQEKNDAINK